MGIETTGARELSADLARASAEAAPKLRAVMERGANNIKRTIQDDLRGSNHFSQVAETVSYDVVEGNLGFAIEIGPDKDRRISGGRPGPLAGIAFENSPSGYFGGSRGGATVRDPQGALDDEQPNLDRYLSEFARGVLDG